MSAIPGAVLHVNESVVSAIAAHHAAAVAGVHSLKPRLTAAALAHLGDLVRPDDDVAAVDGAESPLPSDGVTASIDEVGVAHVEIDVVISFGHSCPAVASAIQSAVQDGVRADAGLESVVRINVVELDLGGSEAER